MAWQFRKTKKIGPIRLTWSKHIIPSISFGFGPLRLSRTRTGKWYRTVRIPFNLWHRKRVK